MSWRGGLVAAWDVESTGVGEEHRIITSALVKRLPDCAPTIREWLADPGRPSTPGALNKHHIADAYAKQHGRGLAEVLDEVAAALAELFTQGGTLVGHGVNFDLTMLDRNCRFLNVPTLSSRLGGEGKIRPVIDTLVLSRHLDSRLDGHSLGVVAARYGVKVDGALHNAATDAMTCLRLAWKMAAKHPKVDIPAVVLHDMQVRLFMPQQVKEAARPGREVDPDMRWPIKPWNRQPEQQHGFQPRLTVETGDEINAVMALKQAGFETTKIDSAGRAR